MYIAISSFQAGRAGDICDRPREWNFNIVPGSVFLPV
jgi:hypothetical protein